MPTATIIPQTFNRNPSAAKRAAADGPLVNTERGRKRFVLMTYEAFEKLKETRNLRRALPELADMRPEVDFTVEREGFRSGVRVLKLLFDTVTISALRRPDRQEQNFRAWLASVSVQGTYLSAVPLAEMSLGLRTRG